MQSSTQIRRLTIIGKRGRRVNLAFLPESRRRDPSHLLEKLGEMGLRREAEGVGYLLHRMRGGREFALYLLHDVFIDDCLRRLAGDAAGNLRQIAATHIQLVGIEMHIAIGAAEVIHLRDKLVVKIGTPALQITLPSQFYIDEILRHRQRFLHLLALIQIDGKGRREAVDETMRIGIIKAVNPR